MFPTLSIRERRTLKDGQGGCVRIPGPEAVRLRETSSAYVEDFELDYRPLNDEIDEEEGLDEDVPDTETLELL